MGVFPEEFAPFPAGREKERGAGDALKQVGQWRTPFPRVKHHPRGRDSHRDTFPRDGPGLLQEAPFLTRGARVTDRDIDIKLGIARVRVFVRTYACRVTWFFYLFFCSPLPSLFNPSEFCQIGNYSNGQSLQIAGHFSAQRYRNGKLPSELPRPLQDRSAQR